MRRAFQSPGGPKISDRTQAEQLLDNRQPLAKMITWPPQIRSFNEINKFGHGLKPEILKPNILVRAGEIRTLITA